MQHLSYHRSRLRVAARLSLCVLGLATPAHALSTANQTFALSIALTGAVYVNSGLDASSEVSISGHFAPSPYSSSSGDGAGSSSASASANGDEVDPFESFAFGVGDQLSATQTTTASASTPSAFAVSGHQLEWVLDAARPLLGDIRLDFRYSPGLDYALHNDDAGARAAAVHSAFASIEDFFGNTESSPITGGSLQNNDPGTLESPTCSQFCSGEFEFDSFSLVLRANGLPSTISIVSDASSRAEIATPVPEPGAGWLLAAGLVLLAARRR